MKKFYMLMSVILLLQINVYGAAVDKISTPLKNNNVNTPTTNVFKIENDGKEFIMFGGSKDKQSFFVYCKDFYGSYVFDPDNTAKFDIEDKNNVAYFLNNEFLKSGNNYNGSIYKLPVKIENYIDYDHVWITEGGSKNTDYPEDFETKAGVVLLSQTEWKENITKFGTGDGATDFAAYLRSSRGKQDSTSSVLYYRVNGENGVTNSQQATKASGIRPAFYLKRAFFTEIRLNISTLGDNVKSVLRNNFSKQELSQVYSAKEISLIFENLPPQANNATIVGRKIEGNVLKGYYNYFDIENNRENGTKFKWYVQDNLTSQPRPINDTNVTSYTLQSKDVGKYVFFEVTPRNKLGIGKAMKSNYFGPIILDSVPEARGASLEGDFIVGSSIKANYTFFDLNGDVEKTTKFEWFTLDKPEGEFKKIEHETEKIYTIKDSDCNQFIKCVITPMSDAKNNKGSEVHTNITEKITSKPTVNQINITGNPIVGNKLVGTYTYYDLSNHIEKNSAVIWQISDKKDGKYLSIENENTLNYSIKDSDVSKYIRLKVIPKKEEFPYNGDEYYSNSVQINGDKIEKAPVFKTQLEKGKFIIIGENLDSVYSAMITVTIENGDITDIKTDLSGYLYKNKRDSNTYDIIISKTGEFSGVNGIAHILELDLSNVAAKVTLKKMKIAKVGGEYGSELVYTQE